MSTPQKKLCSPVKTLTASPRTPEKLPDRYMSSRVTTNLLSAFEKASESPGTGEKSGEGVYSALLKQQLMMTGTASPVVGGLGDEETENVPRMVTDVVSETSVQMMSAQRRIPKAPFKILDAPALQDDFYLNVLDWSSQDVLAVGLFNGVYLWSASTLKVTRLWESSSANPITSLTWSADGTQLAVGTTVGALHLFDIHRTKEIARFLDHSGRIGALAWTDSLLATASRDRSIGLRDLRSREAAASLKAHKQEVCGLKWSTDGRQLASGGNDNQVLLWELHSAAPLARFRQHRAAVKALAWAPNQHGVLLSGGGTADRTIRFWNTLTLEQIHCIETSSQVCSLLFSRNTNEFVSTHGYSLNQISLWNYASRQAVATLTGHACRVLYLALSPDGQTIVTGAGDETLRFWSLFPAQQSPEPTECRLTPSLQDLR